ncbi:GNAT family N-acetyltransferase [Edaphobacillus lindanitolerans]|uniref:Protein N-acetyltransferase, RimJ/RimL family n=1 Tax=Edaphobacillus lindanitolerans TaxID=550447 RepID=A0A1U7PQ92_9BACI|nr:GNAT family N-acetyltransferase [Edaphobacillus lindanitolerans]SIT89385.1 Protein N-acetyltransferase, RimJ/RimL family [Edaphobacillus lindanitolerans]
MKLTEWTMQEQEELIHFMTENSWPYHGIPHPARELIEKAIGEGGYESDEVKTFWVETDEGEKVGIVKLYDMQDEIPMFDLRIADRARGHGYGRRALLLICDYVFSLPAKKIRLEGHTRQDNAPMRKTFERAGFVKEAHLRKAWYSPKEDSYYDAVTYGMTREDFLSGTTTPVEWNDRESGRVEPAPVSGPPAFPDEFRSDRLVIRAPRLEDAADVCDALTHSHGELKEWLPFAKEAPTLASTEESLRRSIADFITRNDLRLHLYRQEDGAFIGSSGLHRIDWDVPKFEIGYWIDSRYAGQGYMTEAVERITEFAFDSLGARRVEIRCDALNLKSRAIPERLGFSLEGLLRNDALSVSGDGVRDTCVYSKVK